MAGKQRANPDRAGFSLIFVAILLTVAALIMVSFLPGREAGDNTKKAASSVQKLEKVEEAMRGFMASHGRRPCPAQGSYQLGQANFGLEAANPGSCTGGTPAAPLGPDSGTSEVVAGTIPTRSLGLPDDYAFDEWGRRFTYVVDKRATARGSCVSLEALNPTTFIPTGHGDVNIESATTGGTVLDQTMYAYISHGPDGYGAFPAQGSTVAGRIFTGSADADEMTDAGVDAACMSGQSNFGHCSVTSDFTANLVQKTPTTTFDDLVWYRPDIKNYCCLGAICTMAGFRIDGTIANEQIGGNAWDGFGSMVGLLEADVNGDGIPDLIFVGADTTNMWFDLFVIFGQPSRYNFPNPFPLSSLNGTNGFVLTDIYPIDNSSWPYDWPEVAVGDLNGDGIADILIANNNRNCQGGSITDYIVPVYRHWELRKARSGAWVDV